MSNKCPKCGQSWEQHEFGVPAPYCPEASSLAPAKGSARCQVTCGDYRNYFKCDRPAKYVTDGNKPPGRLFVCGIHKRGRIVKPIAPNDKCE